MKIPFWKRWWSYVQDIPLEYLESEFNEEIHLLISKGRYQLCSENAIYSFDDLYTNFGTFFSKLDWKNWQPTNMLVLGFGLGSIPFLLEKKYQQQLEITGIEIDPAIVYLASKYTVGRLEGSVELIPTDALIFLQQNQIKYDIIAIDIFLDDKIPKPFLQASFLELIDDSLSHGGLVCFNHLYRSEADKKAATEYFQQVFKPHFSSAEFLQVQQNAMLINHSKNLFAK